MNETLTRTLSGAVYIVLLVGASLFLNSFLVLFALFLLMSAWEFCELIGLKKGPALAISLVLYLLFTFLPLSQEMLLLLVIGSLLVSVRLLFFLFAQNYIALDRAGKYVFLIGYIVLPMILLTRLPLLYGEFKPEIIICVFVLIWANDTFAFLVGKNFGKRKLFERISPKKTIEGCVGGWLFALGFSVLIALYITKEPVYIWLAIATLVSFFGTLGDLVESKFKRMAGVKDSGRIMPGHGGILDRLDSVIFVAPFVFLFYQIVIYVS